MGNDAAMLLARSLCARTAPGAAASRGSLTAASALEFDLHRGGGILGRVAAGGNNHGDGVADIADLVARECDLRARRCQGWVGHQHRDLGARHVRRQVVRGQHGAHAGHDACRRCVDRTDLRVRVRAAHEAGMQHSRQRHVADEARAPGEQDRIFEARDAGAEMLCTHDRCPS